MLAATQHANELPSFESLERARAGLLASKEDTLRRFLQDFGDALTLDRSPESLKRLEKWYLGLDNSRLERNYSLPHAMGFYFGEVLCASSNFIWVVEEFPFEPMKFEIGVQRGPISIMLTKGKQPASAGNKRMESLWREYARYDL